MVLSREKVGAGVTNPSNNGVQTSGIVDSDDEKAMPPAGWVESSLMAESANGKVKMTDGESGGGDSGAVKEASEGDESWSSSPSEFEFHSSTDADPVLDVGEVVRLSMGTS